MGFALTFCVYLVGNAFRGAFPINLTLLVPLGCPSATDCLPCLIACVVLCGCFAMHHLHLLHRACTAMRTASLCQRLSLCTRPVPDRGVGRFFVCRSFRERIVFGLYSFFSFHKVSNPSTLSAFLPRLCSFFIPGLVFADG
eukprot:RCo042716